jgi:translation initiation factor 2B subunit (eIF-2B alpha/beta/delta family)
MSRAKKIDTRGLEYWRPQVQEIQEDSIHSSAYLADKALDIIEEYIHKQLYRNRTELIQNLSKLGNALVRAQPLMALIYNRAHRIIEFIQEIPREEKDINVIREMVLKEIQQIRTDFIERQKSITRLGARLILDQHTVLTHSASSVVENILLEAKRQRKRFRLICTESRPRYEGVELAKKMARAGIRTRLIPDADMTRAVNDAHFVLTGADRVTENTFVNKTGTGAIAVLAKELNKPFYIAVDTDKILLKRVYPTRFRSVHEQEILAEEVPNLTVQNYYFEEVSLSYLHKIISETGIYEVEEFIERFL